MIRIFFQGGLGNQMFQYAAARHLAERHSTELGFDLSWYFNPLNRKFMLPHFGIEAPLKKSFLSCLSNRFIGKPLFELLGRGNLYREKDHQIKQVFFDQPDGVTLIGFFQSEKYFKSVEHIVREEFSFSKVPQSNEVKSLNEKIGDSNSVAVHVRRGDYLTLGGFLVCTEDYYRRAIEYMRRNLESPTFYFFSDDLEWCQENFAADDAVFCDITDSKTPDLDDLRLIASCRHQIISNSSFSWWGAWLGKTEDQVVVAPDRWKATGGSRDDTYCEDWIRMSGESPL